VALVVAALLLLVIERKGRDLGIISLQPVYWTIAQVSYEERENSGKMSAENLRVG
jgi:hypothetical protein